MKIPVFLILIEIISIVTHCATTTTPTSTTSTSTTSSSSPSISSSPPTTTTTTTTSPTTTPTNTVTTTIPTTTTTPTNTVTATIPTTTTTPTSTVTATIPTTTTTSTNTVTTTSPTTTTTPTSTVTTTSPTATTPTNTAFTTTSPTTSTTPTSTIPTTTSSPSTPSPTYQFFTPYSSDYWPHTKILSKKRFDLRNHADTSIQIASPADGDFLTFIRDSAFWVDKSLLIRHIFEGLSTYSVLVLAPPQWGKTINLSMLKFYCELPIDSGGFEIPTHQSPSHFYFNEGKVVSKDGTIEELEEPPLIRGYEAHLGSYPVIYMSGSNLSINNGVESLRMMVHQAYRNHASLFNQFGMKYLNGTDEQRISIFQEEQGFRKYYEPEEIRKLSEKQITLGIRKLARCLHSIYHRPVVILLDDYDHIAYEAYFDGKPSNYSNFDKEFCFTWGNFLSYTFSDNRYLQKGIITGVLKICDPIEMANFPNFVAANPFGYQDLFPYYGIFEKEFRQMASKRGIDPGLVDNATQWYGGYKTLSHFDVEMYSPYSVTRFLNTLRIQNYWQSSRLSRFIHSLLRKPEILQPRIRSMVESFDTGETHLSVMSPLTLKGIALKDYVTLQRVERDEEKYNRAYEQAVFSLLVTSGYAALYEYAFGGKFIRIKIPNREIRSHINAIINAR